MRSKGLRKAWWELRLLSSFRASILRTGYLYATSFTFASRDGQFRFVLEFSVRQTFKALTILISDSVSGR